MKRLFQIIGEVELEYDENSIEFKEALASYREVIDRNGSVEGMLHTVAFHVARFGCARMAEGIGYIGFDGYKPDKEPYSGIMARMSSDFETDL